MKPSNGVNPAGLGLRQETVDPTGSLGDILAFFILLVVALVLAGVGIVKLFAIEPTPDHFEELHFAFVLVGLSFTLAYIWTFCRMRKVSVRDRLWIRFGYAEKEVILKYFFVTIALSILSAMGYLWKNSISDIDMLFRVDNIATAFWRLLSLTGLTVVLLVPIVEEIIIRGFAYPIFRKRFGIARGVIISSSLFAVLHVFSEADSLSVAYRFISAFVIGLFLTFVLERTRNLLWCMIFHSLINLLALIVFYSVRP